jgi:hypothetical protein
MNSAAVNKVVARFADGRIIKGSTADFVPTKSAFHVALADAPPGSRPMLVQIHDLKAVFFVKDLVGNAQRQPRQEFDPNHPVVGRKIKVIFKDGELLVGTTQGYKPGREAFFLVPADRQSNIERCFVIAAATKEITLL